MTDPRDEPCSCGNPNCRCGRCHGTLWIEVQEGYAERIVPDLDLEKAAALTDDERAAAFALIRQRRNGATNTVYPCRACAPSAFFRWAGGHFEADHDIGSCADCSELLGPRRRGKHHRPEASLPGKDF